MRDKRRMCKYVARIAGVVTFIWFWGMILAEGAEMTPLVHQWIGVTPDSHATGVSVTANGARYRFYVALSLNTSISPNPNGDRFYATDGYVYKRSSIAWSVDREGGIPYTESEVDSPTTEGNNYLKSFRWQTPIASGTYIVTLTGQRHRYGGTGGGGPEVWEDFDATTSGSFAYAQIYDTKMIYGDPQVKYGTGTEFAVEPGAAPTVETKVKDGNGDIKHGEVTVYWEKVDPDPANEGGTGSLSANSTKTADGSGVANVTFTCSSTRGDDHIVKAKNKETGATSENNSGKAVVWKVEIISVVPQTFTTQEVENNINCIADIKPDILDMTYNDDIEWDVEDNSNEGGDSGDPDDPVNGNAITWSASIPPISTAPNGRGFPLSYRIRARLTMGGDTVTSDTIITQDEKDQCRQEYVDMSKNSTPARSTFVDSETYNNPGHFSFNQINSGDYDVAVFSIAGHLENIRTAIGNLVMSVNSGYRNPIHNADIGGATNSRHIYGDAADIGLQDWDEDGNKDRDDWNLMRDAAINEGATYIEPYADTKTWVHMDWR